VIGGRAFRLLSNSEERLLAFSDWTYLRTWQGQFELPSALPHDGWGRALVPGTLAGALRGEGKQVDDMGDLDAGEVWYRARVESPVGVACQLRFEGLAPLADVFINGEHRLRSENQFVTEVIPFASVGANEVAIRFRGLAPLLRERRPRPRYKARLVGHQNLRFFRASLLGRMPGWTPPAPALGPYRPVIASELGSLQVSYLTVRPSVAGQHGSVRVAMDALLRPASEVASVSLLLGDRTSSLRFRSENGTLTVDDEVDAGTVELWWPHTHGKPALYSVAIEVKSVDGHTTRLGHGPVGFRSVAIDRSNGAFELAINGSPIFCRGAVWTPLDALSLQNSPEALAHAIDQVVSLGANMLRTTGTMPYETDAFFDALDARGVMLWHDFAFANMDYPTSDATFVASVEREAHERALRLVGRPSLTVLCGGSEIEQQAAMMGLPASEWVQPLIGELLPRVARDVLPDVPYVTSTPTGGSTPFSVDSGVTHYWGVGAYQGPLDDVRSAGVRFAAECLAFSNVPHDVTIESVLASGEMPVVHPKWKATVPRDLSVGWDFEDIREHYVEVLFGERAREIRFSSMDRYLELSRAAIAHVMARTASALRDPRATCGGALVWTLRDLVDGAGWGIIDAQGRPKSAFYGLRRVWQPIAIDFTDDRQSGVRVVVWNDTCAPFVDELAIALYRDGRDRVANAVVPVSVAPRSATVIGVEDALGRFVDPGYSFRFGAPGHDLCVGTLVRRGITACHLPLGMKRPIERDLGLVAHAERCADGSYDVRLETRAFAQCVSFSARGFLPDDDFLDIAPGATAHVKLRPETSGAKLSPLSLVKALNMDGTVAIRENAE
jgi:beta-mannosidase